MYRHMARARGFDRKAMALQRQGRIGTYPPLEGHEAAQIASVMALEEQDWIYPAYREQGSMLARGMPMEVILAYWKGVPNPAWDPSIYREATITVPIASQLPHAVGHAYQARRAGQSIVTMTYFGDGSTSESDFHAGLTFAGVWKAPTVFVCQNNQYAISVPLAKQTAAAALADKALGYGMPGVQVDGMDALAVYAACQEAVERARTGGGPTLIEAMTYRFGPHATADDPSLYRSASEVEAWRERDPLIRLHRYLEAAGIAVDTETIMAEAAVEAEEAVGKIDSWPRPSRADAIRHVYTRIPDGLIQQVGESELAHGEPATVFADAERWRPAQGAPPQGPTEQLTMADALNLALRQTMETDPSTVLLGEDVATAGGVFRVTAGLLDQFGEDRVIDTPLNESGIVGTAIGMAMAGGRPIAEIQFDGFVYVAFDQIVSHLGRMRYRSRGTVSLPVVVRMPNGAGIRAHEHHCDSPESYFAHAPGLIVVIPSTPFDAKGLLAAAIEADDPVIFLEPKVLYRADRQAVPVEHYTIPIGTASVRRVGTDLTLVSYGGLMPAALAAAEAVADAGSIEVIDLRTIYPWDHETVLTSVAKTGRLVIAQEPPRTAGIGAEIAATVADKALYALEAPIRRVCGFDGPMPHFSVEHHGLVDADQIESAIRSTLAE